jgi:fructosamine-3-kinase
MPDWTRIGDALRTRGIGIDPSAAPRPVGGGDISAAWRVATGDGHLFVKTAHVQAFDMLDAEADGLSELQRAAAVRVPRVLARGSAGSDAWLAMEWLEFEPARTDTAHALGRQLAALHRHTAEQFGWHRDNTIGLTPQINTRDHDWIRFLRDRRLVFQLELAAQNGYTGELQGEGARLARHIEDLFQDYAPQPSLLHGDLWGGNWASVDGEPIVFDPAVHYGDRECDLAMTRLFGGFGTDFYEAYQKAWPLDPGHTRRLPLYQLYHVLNHLNLFGRPYLGRALALLRQLNL